MYVFFFAMQYMYYIYVYVYIYVYLDLLYMLTASGEVKKQEPSVCV